MFLGIDLGTSSVKVALMDEHQVVLHSASAELDVTRPHSGWSEQNPDNWISATSQTMASLKPSLTKEKAAVKGIGHTGLMHGATLIDSDEAE